MRRLASLLCLAVVAAAMAMPAAAQPGPAPQMQPSQDSLYKRLGGYDAIAAVTDDFIARMIADPQLTKFFVGFSNESKKRIRQHIVDFLCQATGGPCAYHGKDMKTAHAGINITEAEWQAAVKDLQATFDKFKVAERERNEVLNAISGLKGDIVQGK